jgi:hypothetical protein
VARKRSVALTRAFPTIGFSEQRLDLGPQRVRRIRRKALFHGGQRLRRGAAAEGLVGQIAHRPGGVVQGGEEGRDGLWKVQAAEAADGPLE